MTTYKAKEDTLMGKIKPSTKKIRKNVVPPKSSHKKMNRKTANSTVKLEIDASKFFFMQNSPLSSVPVMDDGHTICKGYDKHINDNNNTFSNEIVKKYYKTFEGAFVFKNHNDSIRDVYGVILSSSLRKIKNGDNFRYIPEILMAISKSGTNDDKFIKKIMETGEVKTSMGVMAMSLMCSLCGSEDGCDHVIYNNGKKYKTKYGYESTISQMVSDNVSDDYEMDEDDYDSYPVFWNENSILTETPAYKGVANSFLINAEGVKGSKVFIEIDERAINRSGIDGINAINYFIRKGHIKVL